MTKYIFAAALIFAFYAGLSSCDKVKDPYPVKPAGELDESLYPGDFSTYPWPVFEPNTNQDRNVLLEDFTGHTCIYCPNAADTAHKLMQDYSGRVFVQTIHAGPSGKENFQSTTTAPFTYDFTNPIGISIATYIAALPGSGFQGNPRGAVSRVFYDNNYTFTANKWRAATNALLAANDLKVNLQAVVNFYPETQGAYIHIEADVLDKQLSPDDLGLVVALIEDSLVKPQKFPSGSGFPGDVDMNYVHRDVLKLHLNGSIFGTTFIEKYLKDEKYYFDYSYKISPHTRDNCHFLIYVVNKETSEVLHVIKAKP